MMEMQKVSSSQINAIGYDAEERTLRVEFNSGTSYVYTGVPPETFAAMLASESVGKFLAAEIKGKFSFSREEPTKEAA
jgi:hypothetical protein